MSEPTEQPEQERRKFIRLDLTEKVMALDENDNEIGRVEKVGAGGMQIRLLPNATLSSATVGSKITVQIVEPGNVRNKFQVEVRMREGDVLGVQFLT